MSHWGWHSFPLPEGWTPERVPPTGSFQQGRNTGGDKFPAGTQAIRARMFDNPHIMNLGRLRLTRAGGRVVAPGEISGLQRTLDLWTGVQTSRYQLKGQDVTVETCVHPSEQGITRDTVFDLAYWRWGLDKAQKWRERRSLPREPHWDEVRKNLAPLPVVDGVFVHSAEWSDTYTKRAWEHPDPVGVFGMLPRVAGVDTETAQRTVRKVWETWNWSKVWGWDFPWMAMMAAGWDGCPDKHAPGFPDDGSWVVRWEGLKIAP